MKKATTTKRRRGRPAKAARDCMVPMSVSVPAPLRDLIDKLADKVGESRSAHSVTILEAGIAALKPKPKRKGGPAK